jgi:hypothetical protein
MKLHDNLPEGINESLYYSHLPYQETWARGRYSRRKLKPYASVLQKRSIPESIVNPQLSMELDAIPAEVVPVVVARWPQVS